MLATCNFTLAEFEEIWALLNEDVVAKYNTGRGRKSKTTAKDALLMLLAVLKQGELWDLMAKGFDMSATVFKKLISTLLTIVSGLAYQVFVKDFADKYTMEQLITKNKQFQHFPTSLYAVDVRFQQTNRPTGNYAEAKVWFSGKHSLYGVKTEAAVLSAGIAIYVSDCFKGSVHNKTILVDND